MLRPFCAAKRIYQTACAAVVACSMMASVGWGATYQFVSYSDLQNGYELTGTITTNGQLGTLAYSDVLDASFTVSNGIESYHTPHASEVYGVTNLLATPAGLYLPASSGGAVPGLKVGSAGFGTPQLQYDYFHNSGVTAFLFGGLVDYPATLNVLWEGNQVLGTPAPTAEPILIAIAVPEPTACVLGGCVMVAALSVRRRLA